MYAIKDLENTLGWSYEQLRARLSELGDSFSEVTKRGKNNKILVTDKGLSILKRLNELEKDGNSIETSLKQIRKELSSNGEKLDKTIPKVPETNQETMQVLKEEVKLLKDQVAKKDIEIERLHDKLDRLLPGSTDHKGIVRKIWARIW